MFQAVAQKTSVSEVRTFIGGIPIKLTSSTASAPLPVVTRIISFAGSGTPATLCVGSLLVMFVIADSENAEQSTYSCSGCNTCNISLIDVFSYTRNLAVHTFSYSSASGYTPRGPGRGGRVTGAVSSTRDLHTLDCLLKVLARLGYSQNE